MAKCNNEEGQLHYLLTESKASNNLKALRPVLVHSEDRFQLIRGLRCLCCCLLFCLSSKFLYTPPRGGKGFRHVDNKQCSSSKRQSETTSHSRVCL